METRLFGNSGKMVSRIGFGGAVAGLKNYLAAHDPGNEDNARGIHEALARALELGINYFDTAIGYGDGASEKLFGDVLCDADPESIFLATKCGGTDYDGTMRSVERSLKHLRRDWIDLLQIHGDTYTDERAGRILAQGGMADALERLKKEKVIRMVGFTTEDQNRAVYDFIESGRFDQIQVCYNLLFQHPYDPVRPFGSLLAAKKANMATVSMRSTTSGTFQKWNKMVRPDDTFDYTRSLIQFALSNEHIDVVLVGMRNAREVEMNVETCADLSGRIDLSELHERYV